MCACVCLFGDKGGYEDYFNLIGRFSPGSLRMSFCDVRNIRWNLRRLPLLRASLRGTVAHELHTCKNRRST